MSDDLSKDMCIFCGETKMGLADYLCPQYKVSSRAWVCSACNKSVMTTDQMQVFRTKIKEKDEFLES